MKNWGHILWPLLRSTKSEKPQPKTTTSAEDDKDRISKLPDDILHHILFSLDTTNQALQTSLLSTRWLHLVRSLPNLTFHFESLVLLQSRRRHTFPSNHNPELMSRFSRSVTRFLSLRDHTSAIDKFTLTSHDRSTDPTLVAKCIDYAVRHGVRHLDIDANCHPTTTYVSEVELFASETLRSLKVKQYANSIIVGLKKMPNLKKLHLDSFGFRDDADDLYRFPTEPFSSLPRLEELTIRDCEVSGLVIRSSTLRVLEISFSLPLYSREARMGGIWAPALRSFRYGGYVSLVIGEILEDMLYLEEVYFDVCAVLAPSPYTDDVRDKMAVNLVRMLQQLGRNAKLVTLTLHTIQVLAMDGELLEESPCPFPGMKCLKLRERRYGGLYPRMEGVGENVMQYLTRGCSQLVVEFPNGGRIYSQGPGIREFAAFQ